MTDAELIKIMFEITKAAFDDNYGAGNIPGSGYSNKPQNIASRFFGWQSLKKFIDFEREVEDLLKRTDKAFEPH